MAKLHEYQEALELLKRNVTAQLDTVAIFIEETGDWSIRTDTIDQTEADSNTQADAVEAADERLSILTELENRYRLINHALKKIPRETFGRCEISGEQIEENRLAANPAARTCTHHMEQEFGLPLP